MQVIIDMRYAVQIAKFYAAKRRKNICSTKIVKVIVDMPFKLPIFMQRKERKDKIVPKFDLKTKIKNKVIWLEFYTANHCQRAHVCENV